VHPLFAQYDAFNELPKDSTLAWLNAHYVENPKNFHERALQALARSYQLQDEQFIAEMHLLLMRWHGYHVLFTIDSVFYHGEKAIDLFEQTGDRAKLATTGSELAFEYIDDNNLERSEELIFEAISIFEAMGDNMGLGAAYYRLSSIFNSQNEPELSIKYALEALEIAKLTKDYETTQQAWLVLVLAYHEAGEFENAIHAAEKCIETINDYQIDDQFNLARAYGYRGDVWAELKEYQKSLEDNLKSYAIVEAHIGAERPAAKTYRHGIGLAYYMQGKFQEALPHLEATIDGYRSLGQGNKPKTQELYEQAANAYYQLGDYQSAYQNQKLAKEVVESLMQSKVANLEAEALIKYESGKKDQAISEQTTIIQQQTRIQSLGTTFIVVLVFFLGMLYYYFRRNKKIASALFSKNQENELLLKEIHHRVKNNLQTVSSLLSLQSESISDKGAYDAVHESKNRVTSMALIHQKLYQGESLAAIEMRDYFETIGKAIVDSFGEKAENVSLKVDMNEVELDVDTAVPIGLITNELLTNSIKHAFTDTRRGQILITLSKEENGMLKLNIADNGNGTANRSIPEEESGFGTLLIQLLTTQLGGRVEKSTDAGTSTTIYFTQQEKSAA
jgi:two-component sensor histidine kinase